MLLLGAYRISFYICERLTKPLDPAVSHCQGIPVSGPGFFSVLFHPPTALQAWRKFV